MSTSKHGLMLDAVEEHEAAEAEHAADERRVYLQHGRTLAVTAGGVDETIEIRGSGGQVELRIKMTEDGPVLQVDAVRVAIKAEDAIALECRRFAVTAAESVDISSEGELGLRAREELNVRSEQSDVRVKGERIFLN